MNHFHSRLDSRDKVILGCCAVATVVGFLPWYQVSFAGADPAMAEFFASAANHARANAFGASEGLLAWLAALATAALVVAERDHMLPWPVHASRWAAVASAGLSLLFLVSFFGHGSTYTAIGVSGGRTVWFYAALLAMSVATWQAVDRLVSDSPPVAVALLPSSQGPRSSAA